MLNSQTIYEAQITGYTSDGRGVAHIDGCAVFIPNAIAGERCTIRVVHQGRTAAIGKIEQILVPSPHRVPRACPYAKLCGGCSFWHMDYAEEQQLKAQRVTDALSRIGGCDIALVSITGAPEQQHYRNKALYPVGKIRGRAEAGFFRAGTHQIIPIDRCLIQHPSADLVRQTVVQYMRRFQVPAYDEQTGKGLVRHVFVRCGVQSGQVLAGVIVNGSRLPHSDALIDMLRRAVPGLCGIVLCENRNKSNAILTQTFTTLWGSDNLIDCLCDLEFEIAPRAFYQVNHDQAERLYRRAVELAQLTGKERVLDLYCGVGTITCVLAQHAAEAIGVEVVADAVENAKKNAARNGLRNVSFFCADAGQAAQQLAEQGTHPDVIVVDPPRKGLDEAAIAAAVQMAPQRIVYVSCDPATLARDAKRFAALGYVLEHAEAFDLFPRTAHVESVALLAKQQ